MHTAHSENQGGLGEAIQNLSGDGVTKLRHKEGFIFSHFLHPLEGVKQHST
jgi:hypothetical protein